jgi:hypothetical protein
MTKLTKVGLAAAGVVMTLATSGATPHLLAGPAPVSTCEVAPGSEEVTVGWVTVCVDPVDVETLLPTYGSPTYGFPTYGTPTHGLPMPTR